MQYRQGDVFIRKIDKLPKNLAPIEPDNGRNILAYGEVTGHAHALEATETKLYSASNDNVFLRVVSETALLTHEEHTEIKLPAGFYEVIRQREYMPEEIRYVAD